MSDDAQIEPNALLGLSDAQASEPPPLPANVPPPLPADTPTPVQPIRFCRSCGAPWDPSWDQCPHCYRPPAPDAAAGRLESPDAGYRRDIGTVKYAAAMYFSLLAVSAALIIAVVANDGKLTATGDFVASIVFALIVLAFCARMRTQLLPVLARGAKPQWFALAIGAAIPTYLLASAVVWALGLAGVPIIHYSQTFLKDGYGWGVIILSVAVAPAIFEELAFRGVIQTSLQRVLSDHEAMWVTALMFVILHLSVPSMPHLLLIGIALGWLRMKTGSLYPGMLLHFTHNLLVVASERSGGLLPW